MIVEFRIILFLFLKSLKSEMKKYPSKIAKDNKPSKPLFTKVLKNKL